MDIASLLTASSVGVIVGSLITRGTARSSSRTERTDEYRREVRSAASSIVRAAQTFIDAAKAFDRSIFWNEDAVRVTPDHAENYLACQTTRAQLEEKIADFQLLADVDVLSNAAFWVQVHVAMAYFSMVTTNISSEWSKYTESQLEGELEEIRSHTYALKEKVVPEFLERVKKYVPHTIVEEKRRRARILRPFTASWRWMTQQHRKNLAPSKQKSSDEIDPSLGTDSVTPAVGGHVAM